MEAASMNEEKKFERTGAQADDLMNKVAAGASQTAAAARDSLGDAYSAAKETVMDAQTAVIDKGTVAVKAAGRYVDENPWVAVGAAAAIGIALGMLVRRR
jgi:ElaB/YqjD/DUF883 family membrane-anchored ribosome-binding protein